METSISGPARVRRIGIVAGIVCALLPAIAWMERRRIAIDLVDRRLAAAGVTGRYRIVALGPVRQVIEDVRLGDPIRPDLVAARLELGWRYRLGVPELTAVRATGMRLSGRWVDGRISLGALDRLLPRAPTGKAGLPDLDVQLRDVTLTLHTPAGVVQAQLAGAGNPTRDFGGTLHARTPALLAGRCAIDASQARLQVLAGTAGLRLTGPVAAGPVACPALRVRPGQAMLDMLLAPTLDRAVGTMSLAGFSGASEQAGIEAFGGTIAFTASPTGAVGRAEVRSGAIALASLHAEQGRLAGSYRIGRQQSMFDGDVAFTGAGAAPALVRKVAAASQATRATPLGPLVAQAGGRLGQLLSGADVQGKLAFGAGARTTMRLERARIRARAGAELLLAGGLELDRDGWALQGQMAGKDLPSATIRARRSAADGPVEAIITPSPYRAGTAMLSLEPVRLRTQAGATRIETRATLSGPMGSGAVEGLEVPVALTIAPDGTTRLDPHCINVRARQVRLASITLDPANMRLCGAPILAVSPQGRVEIDGHSPGILLSGRSGAAPLRLASGPGTLTRAGFSLARVDVRLGTGPDPTRLAVGMLDGRFDASGPGGRFAEAAGSISGVPLALSGAGWTWRIDGGVLHLNGALAIADRAASARFAKLAARDVALSLASGRIVATGTLLPNGRTEAVAAVTVRHDLTEGRGGADIAVPGLTFARGGLQPEMLTPLTLGIVANVAGTVRGEGRIDWSPAGTTSHGDFRTDRLDLAAAFGPVTGISGAMHFTDLLGLVTAPHQEIHVAAINPGVAVTDGVVRYHLPGAERVAVENGRWPFAGGSLTLEPALLDFSAAAERRLTVRVDGLDAATFVQQLDFPNIAATGTFDGWLPMVFDDQGGRIAAGGLRSRGPGTLAYVGPLSNAQLGTMGKIAFDALKAIRYSRLDLALDGKLDGEIVTRVAFDGVRQGKGTSGLVARAIRDLPFRFNIAIRAPFRALVGTAASYADPALLLQRVQPSAVQPADSASVR